MSRTLVIAGSHTDIGKTYVACRLVERWVLDGVSVEVLKPVMSGFDPSRADLSDAGRLLQAAGRISDNPEDLDEVDRLLDRTSPWRFPARLAPDAAARAAGTRLLLAELVGFSRRPSPADVVVLETAGGVMSPIAEDGTTLDLVAQLGAPTVLVVGTYLGGISHGLTAHLALASRGVDVAAVVVNRARAGEDEAFRRFLPGVPVFALPEGAGQEDESLGALAEAAAPALGRAARARAR